MNSSIPYTHSDLLLELSEFPSSKNSQVPETLEFQKLSSSKSHQVPKAIEFHPSELEFQNTSEFQRTEFHHSELQFHTTSVLHQLEFHSSELEFQNTSRATYTFGVPQQFKFHGILPSSVIS